MARKKSPDASKYNDVVNSRMLAQRARMEDTMGDDIVPVAVAGIALPSLALRYLFRLRVMPFCRSYLIYGPPGSCKSSLCYYIYKLFVDHGGRYMHLETEDKDQQELRVSVLGYPPHLDDNEWRNRCPHINAYQKLFYGYTGAMRDACAKAKIGRTMPFVVGVDSLMAKLPEHTLSTFEKQGGEVTPRFGEAANSIAQWFRFATNELHGWPFCLVGVNHDKEKSDRHGNPNHNAPGGSSQTFMATTRILCEKVNYLKRSAEGVEGVTVRCKTDKNSASTTGQYLEVDFKWNATGERQVSWWDWDKATVLLLHALMENESASVADPIKDLTGLSKKNAGAWMAKPLGVTEYVSPSELGKVIEASPVMEQLDRILEIRGGHVFTPGLDMSTHLTRTVLDDE